MALLYEKSMINMWGDLNPWLAFTVYTKKYYEFWILQNVVTEKEDIIKQLKDTEKKLNEWEQKQSLLEKNY